MLPVTRFKDRHTEIITNPGFPKKRVEEVSPPRDSNHENFNVNKAVHINSNHSSFVNPGETVKFDVFSRKVNRPSVEPTIPRQNSARTQLNNNYHNNNHNNNNNISFLPPNGENSFIRAPPLNTPITPLVYNTTKVMEPAPLKTPEQQSQQPYSQQQQQQQPQQPYSHQQQPQQPYSQQPQPQQQPQQPYLQPQPQQHSYQQSPQQTLILSSNVLLNESLEKLIKNVSLTLLESSKIDAKVSILKNEASKSLFDSIPETMSQTGHIVVAQKPLKSLSPTQARQRVPPPSTSKSLFDSIPETMSQTGLIVVAQKPLKSLSPQARQRVPPPSSRQLKASTFDRIVQYNAKFARHLAIRDGEQQIGGKTAWSLMDLVAHTAVSQCIDRIVTELNKNLEVEAQQLVQQQAELSKSMDRRKPTYSSSIMTSTLFSSSSSFSPSSSLSSSSFLSSSQYNHSINYQNRNSTSILSRGENKKLIQTNTNNNNKNNKNNSSNNNIHNNNYFNWKSNQIKEDDSPKQYVNNQSPIALSGHSIATESGIFEGYMEASSSFDSRD